MITLGKEKIGVYYKISSKDWNLEGAIMKLALVSVLALGFLTISILAVSDVYAESQSVSRSFTTTITVLPKHTLQIEAPKIEEDGLLLDSKSLLNALSSGNPDLSVENTIQDGEEVILVTKVGE